MRRRELIALLGGAAVWPLIARAQQTKTPRIGFLGATNAATYAAQLAGFRSGLRDFGYVEGQNINIDFRWADGDYDRLAPLVAELAALKVDVIVTHGTPGTSVGQRNCHSNPHRYGDERGCRHYWTGTQSRTSWRQRNWVNLFCGRTSRQATRTDQRSATGDQPRRISHQPRKSPDDIRRGCSGKRCAIHESCASVF